MSAQLYKFIKNFIGYNFILQTSIKLLKKKEENPSLLPAAGYLNYHPSSIKTKLIKPTLQNTYEHFSNTDESFSPSFSVLCLNPCCRKLLYPRCVTNKKTEITQPIVKHSP